MFANQGMFGNHHDTIRNLHGFIDLGYQYQRGTFASGSPQPVSNIAPGLNIHALERFIEYESVCSLGQPAGNGNLLLVATRECR